MSKYKSIHNLRRDLWIPADFSASRIPRRRNLPGRQRFRAQYGKVPSEFAMFSARTASLVTICNLGRPVVPVLRPGRKAQKKGISSFFIRYSTALAHGRMGREQTRVQVVSVQKFAADLQNSCKSRTLLANGATNEKVWIRLAGHCAMACFRIC